MNVYGPHLPEPKFWLLPTGYTVEPDRTADDLWRAIQERCRHPRKQVVELRFNPRNGESVYRCKACQKEMGLAEAMSL